MEERERVYEVLDGEFVDVSPYQAFASLLERGEYLCSVSTMYRLLRKRAPIRERRDQLRHPDYPVPRLTASAPNQVWSWDITKLPGPMKWSSYYLYVIIDLFSRYVVGFMVAERENSELATQLIRQTYEKQGVSPGEVTLHADRGAQMTSKTTSQLLIDLGVAQSHSRPRVSNDNAFSESQFKTLKYRPEYPGHFEGVEEARAWARETMGWYNHEHFHKGLGLMRPSDVHHGKVEAKATQRQDVLEAAMARHPERFVRGEVKAPRAPERVHLNPRSKVVEEDAGPGEQGGAESTGSSGPLIKPVARPDDPVDHGPVARTDRPTIEH